MAAGAITLGHDRLRAEPDGLQAHAAPKNMFFGCAVEARPLAADAAYKSLVVQNAGWIVPGFEMKWGQTEASRSTPDYIKSDAIVQFAQANGLRMRGHTALWYLNIPKWLPDALGEPDARRMLLDHVAGLLSRYRGRIQQWDVINEALEPKDELPNDVRDSIFFKRFGPDYITDVYRVARSTAPEAKLFYNDYGLDYDDGYSDRKRDAVLQLVSRLRREGLVDGLGMQSHLKVGSRFNPTKYRAFLRDAAALGVELVATEFDVDDTRLPAEASSRDPAIAAHARAFLDVLFDEPAVRGLVCWGLSSRYSWLNAPPVKRRDGAPTRGLPFDVDGRPTMLFATIAAAFDRAAVRPSQPG